MEVKRLLKISVWLWHASAPMSPQTQKRYLHIFLNKPKGLKVRQYVARVLEINEILQQFPPQAGVNASLSQKLPNDEILDLLGFGMPSSWQKTMVIQGFIPLSALSRRS